MITYALVSLGPAGAADAFLRALSARLLASPPPPQPVQAAQQQLGAALPAIGDYPNSQLCQLAWCLARLDPEGLAPAVWRCAEEVRRAPAVRAGALARAASPRPG
jgi:hypothetical protein